MGRWDLHEHGAHPFQEGLTFGPWPRPLALTDSRGVGRPTNKSELIAAATDESDRLWTAVGAVPTQDGELPGPCEAWSVKDLLAHLHAWHQMALSWEEVGSAGEKPAIPAEGFTFAETPALNEAIYQRTCDDAWDDVVDRLRATHAELMAVIDSWAMGAWTGSVAEPPNRSVTIGARFCHHCANK